MAGESAAHMILFIATILIASSVSAVMIVTMEKMSIEIKNQGEFIKEVLSTDFEIINDPVNIPTKTIGTDTAYVFYIKNIGSTSFAFTNETLTVLIDGQIVSKQNVITDPSVLNPGDVGELDVSVSLSSGNHRITVILENGVSDSLDFTI